MGLIIIIVVVAVVLLLCIVGLVLCCYLKNKRYKRKMMELAQNNGVLRFSNKY